MTTAADRRWFAAVASIESCVLCNRWGVQVAHSNQLRGLSQKAAAHNTAALCRECHHEIDNGSKLTQEERRALMNRAIVLTHHALILSGKLRLAA